jgi:ribosomal protein S18 acetylase RimI-like enzyme
MCLMDNQIVSYKPPLRDLVSMLQIKVFDEDEMWTWPGIESNWWNSDPNLPHIAYDDRESSRILLIWFESGWLRLEAEINNPHLPDVSTADWVSRATADGHYLVLSDEDTRMFLGTPALWADRESISLNIILSRTEAGRARDTSEWFRAVGAPMLCTVRRATLEDVGTIACLAEVVSRGILLQPSPFGHRFDHAVAALEPVYRRYLVRRAGVWIASDVNMDVGFVISRTVGFGRQRRTRIDQICVSPSHVGSDAAQRLLDAAATTAACVVVVPAEGLRAQAFFRRNGFELDGISVAIAAAPWFAELPGVQLSRSGAATGTH